MKLEGLSTPSYSPLSSARRNKRSPFFICAGCTVIALTAIFVFSSILPSLLPIYRSGSASKPLQCRTPYTYDATLQPNAFPVYQYPKANATFVMLARNSDLKGVIHSMHQVEGRFNKDRRYGWVFLNDEEFTDEFKACTSAATQAETRYGTVPAEQWNQPLDIDEGKASQSRLRMQQKKIPYAGSVSYRNMCRFYSGFFYRHELLQNYEYYWRVEPDISYRCEIDYDPFLFMEQNNKSYAFTITMTEFPDTVSSLWDATKGFMRQHPEALDQNSALRFLSRDGGDSWNYCHFWSNFEIASLSFFRSPLYNDFFNYLDSFGGFYYERWGDAPVHSIAAALFLPRDKLHFFGDIGYEHDTIEHCPALGEGYERGRCTCNLKKTWDKHKNSCLKDWRAVFQ